MEKKEDKALKEKRFVKLIIFLFVLIFIISYSFRFDFFYYPFIYSIMVLGIVLMPFLTIYGLMLYPINVFLHAILPTKIGPIPIALSTIYDFAALAGLFLILFIKEKKKKFNFNDILALTSVALLHILLLIHDLPISFSNYRYILFLDAVLIYFIVSKIIYKKQRIRFFLWILILASMFFVFRFFHHASTFQQSIAGFGNNSISRGLAFIIPLAIYLFWSEKSKYLKGILIIILAFSIQTLLVLGSRASWISLFPVLIIIGIKNIKRKTTLLFGTLAIILVLFFVISSPEIITEFGSITEQVPRGEAATEGSVQSRFRLIKMNWELFKEKPILGWGPGETENTLGKQKGIYKNTHNSYLELMVGWGIFGVIIYLMLFVFSIINAYKAQKLSEGKDKFIYNISWGIIFSLIVVGINQFMINNPAVAVAWIGFGLSAALYYNAKHTKKNN